MLPGYNGMKKHTVCTPQYNIIVKKSTAVSVIAHMGDGAVP
jgi:hypothetical protein